MTYKNNDVCHCGWTPLTDTRNLCPSSMANKAVSTDGCSEGL